MVKRLTAPSAVALALGLAACGSSSAPTPTVASASSRPTTLYTVSLTGAHGVPPGAPHGRGVAIIAFHGPREVCFRFAHLHGFVDATMAHIHAGTVGHAGPVAVVLSPGPKLHHQGCRSISSTVSRKIVRAPGAFYVNVHSRRYPAGAVRGQL